MGSTVTGSTEYAYGTAEEVQDAYQELPQTAQEARELMDAVRADGMVVLKNGKVIPLPLFFEAAVQKYGLTAFAGQVLAYFAGYPKVTLTITLQTLLSTDTMLNVMQNELLKANFKLESLDPAAYAQGVYSAWTANPRVFKEAYFTQYQSGQPAPGFNHLMDQLAWAGLDYNGGLRNPLKGKNGKAPRLNIALLLFLAQSGQIGLLMMVIYRQNHQMASQMAWNLVGVLNAQNKMKREIMKKVASLSERAADDPATAQELQRIQMQYRSLEGAQELTTAMLKELKDGLKDFFDITMETLRTEHQINQQAARA